MNYRGHMKAGVITAGTVALVYASQNLNAPDAVWLTIVSASSSLLTSQIPDLDSETSRISHSVPIISILRFVAVMGLILNGLYIITGGVEGLNSEVYLAYIIRFACYGFLYMSLKHRKLLHSLEFNVLLSYIIAFFIGTKDIFSLGLVMGMCTGLMSHLGTDCMTVEGCPLLYPLPINVSICKFKSGKDDKKILAIVGAVCILIVFAMNVDKARVLYDAFRLNVASLKRLDIRMATTAMLNEAKVMLATFGILGT